MSERSLIFNANGVQIDYIEGSRAFDLTGRERCNYARTTGNLSDLNGEKIVGHISFDGTFVGLSWISDQLFGKLGGGVHPNRILARKQRPHLRPKKQPEKLGVKEPMDVSPRVATASHGENPVEHSPAVSQSGGDPETSSNASKIVADEVPVQQDELTVGTPDPSKSSSTENELLGRAIGMIRSALEKGSE